MPDDRRDGGHFFASQGAAQAMKALRFARSARSEAGMPSRVSVVCSLHMSELERRLAEKWPRPFGLRPKWRHAALLVVHLGSLNFTPRALPGAIWDSNAAIVGHVNKP